MIWRIGTTSSRMFRSLDMHRRFTSIYRIILTTFCSPDMIHFAKRLNCGCSHTKLRSYLDALRGFVIDFMVLRLSGHDMAHCVH